MYFLPCLEPVCCSISSSDCCFLTCIQISKEAGQVVWYSHLFQNFPEFVVIHIVKGFSTVNKAEIFFWNPAHLFSKTVTSWCFIWECTKISKTILSRKKCLRATTIWFTNLVKSYISQDSVVLTEIWTNIATK